MEINKIYQGDCLELMKQLPDKSIDLVLTDPPYGVTQNLQDVCVDMSLFINHYPSVIFSQQPFTADLVSGNKKLFKYEIIWDKVLTSGFLNANIMPLRRHENILIFGKVKYNPQKIMGAKNHSKGTPKVCKNENYGNYDFIDNADKLGELKYPNSIITFSKPHPSIAKHRTEKPIDLILWLLKTYSDEGDLILDPFMGSGTTALACKMLNRNFIGFELEPKYVEIANKRIEDFKQQLVLT
jgi:site-specific DNA-methyltransferase (adenine-specific)